MAKTFFLAGCVACLPLSVVSGESAESARAPMEVTRIWNEAPHNAFPDLIRFNDLWVCGFREASAHAGGVRGSRMRILVSEDGESWKPAAQLSDERGDIRDAKFALMPDGRLMFLTAIQLFDTSEHRHQSLVWFTQDLKEWDGPYDVGEPSIWLWGITWHEGVGYSIGYRTAPPQFTRLYKTIDGRNFEPLVKDLQIDASYANESKIVFAGDGTAYCLLRTDRPRSGGAAVRPDDGKARVGTSHPPYSEWRWRTADRYVGGPAMLMLPDGRILGGGRSFLPDAPEKPRTMLFRVDPSSGELAEWLTLPSAGDSSYPGLVWLEGKLWVAYYSSHEGKSSIYVAQIPLDVLEEQVSSAHQLRE